jgi:hypothetical protein
MGFQENRSDIAICNKALSRIKQQPLSGSLSDVANLNKFSAQQCVLWYKTIVRQVLTSHHWGLATVRVALAAVANTRSDWPFAFAPPSDMAFPVMIGPYSSSAGVSYYQGLGYLLASLYGKPVFLYEGGVIYSILDAPTLDYVSFNITEMDFNDAVEALVVLFLAAQLARSIAKDDKLGDDLHKEGMNRLNLEIARNLNMSQPRYGNFISEGERARDGFDPMLSQYGFTG